MPSQEIIALIHDDPDRAAAIRAPLLGAGWHAVVVPAGAGLARRIAALDPRAVLIDAGNRPAGQAEALALACDPMARAVAMFVAQTDRATTQRMVGAGLAAYVVGGPQPERVGAIIDTAIARFALLGEMRAALDAARAALEDRKVIDRAKGVVMRARGIDEQAAYALMRRKAMESGRKIADIARTIVTAAAVLE